MSITIENAVDSARDVCYGGCVSWLLHWENNTGIDAEKCSAVGCHEKDDLVGAHVYKYEEDSDECYIIPLCRSHNHHTNYELEVRNDTIFVPDYELEDCTEDYEYDEEE